MNSITAEQIAKQMKQRGFDAYNTQMVNIQISSDSPVYVSGGNHFYYLLEETIDGTAIIDSELGYINMNEKGSTGLNQLTLLKGQIKIRPKFLTYPVNLKFLRISPHHYAQ